MGAAVFVDVVIVDEASAFQTYPVEPAGAVTHASIVAAAPYP